MMAGLAGWMDGYAAFLVLEVDNVHWTCVRLCYFSASTSLKYLLLFYERTPSNLLFGGFQQDPRTKTLGEYWVHDAPVENAGLGCLLPNHA